MSEPDPQFHHIAIVDDDVSVRIALSSLLRSYGYTADAYESAHGLLGAGALGDYHCIISDLQMPGMSGIELLEQLRRQGNRLPLILITAFPEAALRDRALQAGAICFLSKPFQATNLIRCLRQARGDILPSIQESS